MPFDRGHRWTRPHIYAYTTAGVILSNWVGIDPQGNWRVGYFPLIDGWPDYTHGFTHGVPAGSRFPFGLTPIPYSPP